MWTSLLGEFGHLIGFVELKQNGACSKMPFIANFLYPYSESPGAGTLHCRLPRLRGNQSCALAVTHGLGKNAVIEVYPAADNASKFGRSNIMRVLPGQHPDFAVIDQWCDGLPSGLPASRETRCTATAKSIRHKQWSPLRERSQLGPSKRL
jgi:hypothetical protein